MNTKMMDYAAADSRSVKAMLAGTGDKREKAWEAFKGKHEPYMTQEELMKAFERVSRFKLVINKKAVVNSIRTFFSNLLSVAKQ